VPSLELPPESTHVTSLATRLSLLEHAHRQELESRDATLASYRLQNKLLTEQVRLLRLQKYGNASEKYSPDQLGLTFNEAESLAAVADTASDEAKIIVPTHERKTRGHRKALSADLPRVEVIHDLPETEKTCPHDGTALKVIGKETSEQLDYIPAKVQVLKHVRLKYGCPCCEQTVKLAVKPLQMLPKSNASPSLLAHIITAKYADGLPLYRQETQFARLGIELPRATSARWIIQLGNDLLLPLINLMNERLLAQSLIHLDETPLQVLKSDKDPQSTHYLWVRAAGPPGKRMVLFDHDPSRGQAVPQRLLPQYQGAILTDGYEAYGAVAKAQSLIHAGCWAHARRKFDEARKVAVSASIERNRADEFLALIRELYAIERQLKERTASDAECFTTRQHHSALIITKLKTALDTQAREVLPKSLLGKALSYALNQWPKLTVFLQHGHIPLDNNRAENAIRPFVIGRKNWLFCDTVAGAQASANVYSLIETAKANGFEPHAYLTRLFTELPNAKNVTDIEALLPFKQA
jgi:transposase